MRAAGSLRRALAAQFSAFVGCLEFEELSRRDWASVTFSGERHRLRLRLDGADAAAAADAFLDGLAEREFDLRGHVVIDIAARIEAREEELVSLLLEALTVAAD